MLIDTHCHLFFQDFESDLSDVLSRARRADVQQIVVPGTDLRTSLQALALAERRSGIFACIGVHPHDAAKASASDLQEMETLASRPSVVAIGEIGLDYHYEYSPRDVQRTLFRALMEMAVRTNKPAVIHTRESIEEAINMCDDIISAHPSWLPSHRSENGSAIPRRGVFHCFPGTVAQASHLRDLGFFVSYPGIVTFKKSNAMAVVTEFGYENILLETDAPFMSPVPFRGKRNEPANVSVIAEAIANAARTSLSEVALRTTENARTLFSLPPHLVLE